MRDPRFAVVCRQMTSVGRALCAQQANAGPAFRSRLSADDVGWPCARRAAGKRGIHFRGADLPAHGFPRNFIDVAAYYCAHLTLTIVLGCHCYTVRRWCKDACLAVFRPPLHFHATASNRFTGILFRTNRLCSALFAVCSRDEARK